ncbi:CBS domain-containing protein [Thermomonospora echinospora]|uniref:CBS domain-containing protein n=1 Tax=Thermomonospora echinospora TaxID=1992 RepID=A0A1H5XJJ0_9ACTN|nr:CBS domain-containing protein [Thermomonospora echinospora]SEG11803.1 CBS domain-containing protein [Thermomonospora echinospora]
MLARELARDFPTIDLDSDALEAARLLVERGLPGLIVVDSARHPVAVLPGSQLLRFVVPRYVQDDPTLAHVYAERQADRLADRLRGHRVRDLLPERPQRLPVVEGGATAMEIAALMAAEHSPLVAVVESGSGPEPPMIGAISVVDLLARALPPR